MEKWLRGKLWREKARALAGGGEGAGGALGGEGKIFKTRLRWLTPSSRIPVYPGVRANKRIDFQFCHKDSTLTLSEPTRFADYI